MRAIVIGGPTGVGKTEISLKLAKALKAEIISVDSAQVYRGLDIGTAKIAKEEQQDIFHHMIDIVEPIKKYNVGEFQKEVDRILKEREGKNIILVGGTGLYIDSVVRGLANLPNGNERIREDLSKKDIDELYDVLKTIDPESADSIHKNNRRRVERALEVFYETGKKFSTLSKQNIKGNRFKFFKVALERDRENLYKRIDKRVEAMIDAGLVDEVETLYKVYGENLRKINIIGYSEIIDYLEGLISLERAIELIKKNSRNYAKRQFTWFKNDSEYKWYNLDYISVDEICSDILKSFENY